MKTARQILDSKISEREVKKACEDYLQYQQNMGNLIWLRLNSGMILIDGEKTRVVKGCQKGTSDLLVVRNGVAWFIEAKKPGEVQTESQKEFEEKVVKCGGIYKVVHALEEMTEAFDRFDSILQRVEAN